MDGLLLRCSLWEALNGSALVLRLLLVAGVCTALSHIKYFKLLVAFFGSQIGNRTLLCLELSHCGLVCAAGSRLLLRCSRYLVGGGDSLAFGSWFQVTQ